MSKGKGALYHSVVFTGGLIGALTMPVLTAGAVVKGGVISELFKEVFKGLTGEHFPGFKKALAQRLNGVDASKLNHDLQKAMEYAIDQTRRSLEHLLGGRSSMPAGEREFLDELCRLVKTRLEQPIGSMDDRHALDAFIDGGKASVKDHEGLKPREVDWTAQLEEFMKQLQADMGGVALSVAFLKVVKDNFHKHFRLHFMELIKDDDQGKARVAFEALTSRTILDELRSIKDTLGRGAPSKEAIVGEVRRAGTAEVLEGNIDRVMERYPDTEALRVAIAPAINETLGELLGAMEGIRGDLQGLRSGVLSVGGHVKETKGAVNRNITLTAVVLAAVIAVAVFFVLDPLHLRSFPLKVEIRDHLGYAGQEDRVAARLAISYDRDRVRDTVPVVEGRASFTIPDKYRNDDAVLRLLCYKNGQSATEARTCDSSTVRLTDQDRIRFPVAAVLEAHAPAGSTPRKGQPADRHLGEAPVERATAPPCPLDGLDFLSESSLEDRLTITALGGGKASISGEVNRKPVQGTVRVNGTALTVVANEGTLSGGGLQLVQDCRALKGTLSLRSPTGNTITERVSMLNAAR